MKSAVILGTLASVLALASPARAQMCPYSRLSYIVRDARGTPVDAASKSFAFGGSADNSAWSEKSFILSYSGFETKIPTDLLSTVKDKITPLTVDSIGSCIFRNGATLSVKMAGKTMDLIFNIEQPLNDSHYYLVDGLPFQEGRFEITLPPVGGQFQFYPAQNWTKLR
jgi:hypothetical protein